MKKITTVVLCALAIGLIGCAKQNQPEKYAERDYNIADARPACPAAGGKFGKECPNGDMYK